MPLEEPRRVILRAEVRYDGQTSVTHTVELGERLVVLGADDLVPLGTQVIVRLSWPGSGAACELPGAVVARHVGANASDPSTLTVEWRLPDEVERASLAAFLRAFAPTVGAEEARRPEGYRVLLVEDNGLVRDMFSHGVKRYFGDGRERVHVDLAPDGNQALALLEANRYDFAIVDYYMPNLDGEGFVRRLRGDARHAKLPVVGISVGGAEARRAMLAAGVDFFLPKPLMLRDLLGTIDRLLGAGNP